MKTNFFVLFLCFTFSMGWAQKTTSTKALSWQFPLPRTHTGMLMGNTKQGLMVWGSKNQLNITIAKAGFWDHRFGYEFPKQATYKKISQLLYENKNDSLQLLFEPPKVNGKRVTPYQIGGGRLEIYLPKELELDKAELDLETAEITIYLNDKSLFFKIKQSMFEDLAEVTIPKGLENKIKMRLISSYEHKNVGKILNDLGVSKPEKYSNTDSTSLGFYQKLTNDSGLSVKCSLVENKIRIQTSFHAKNADVDLQTIQPKKIDFTKTNKFWKEYWQKVPIFKCTDKELEELYFYGLYKQASCTSPHGVACTLQGPFMEEYQLPPWSNDYHYNINVEEIYWPTLATYCTDHLNPIWKMIENMLPEMQKNGKQLFGTDNALFIPHATDDLGQIMGGFWSGSIDHANIAWMAQLAWLHYRYSMDTIVLKKTALPLMIGAFEGYYAMLEKISLENGKYKYSLPVSVSPEFKGKRIDAWGRDASFQLAALHMTCRNLIQTAQVLNLKIDQRWIDVDKNTPEYTIINSSKVLEYPEHKCNRIALWENMDLIESHRHHSHLACIYPFATIDANDTIHKAIMNYSLANWRRCGMGFWTGWSIPWASVINARTGNASAAVSMLYYWKDNFVNMGRGTLHDADFEGLSMNARSWNKTEFMQPHGERMQLDAGFAFLTAIHELFVQQRGETLYILPDLPLQWKECSIENVRTEGAFQVSVWVAKSKVEKIKIKSLVGGNLKANTGLKKGFSINGVRFQNEFLTYPFKPNEQIEIISF